MLKRKCPSVKAVSFYFLSFTGHMDRYLWEERQGGVYKSVAVSEGDQTISNYEQ